jgi:alpha,alpha-trehalase
MSPLSGWPRPLKSRKSHPGLTAFALVLCILPGSALAQQFTPATSAKDGVASILAYIHSSWDTLTRSMTRCDSVIDPKIAAPSVLYLPADYPEPASVHQLQQDCKVDVKHLPAVIHRPGELDPQAIFPPGLLFLENSYVVPGGRFNEMYGWDSYFILLGLLRDGRIDLARGMLENFFFEIAHYGTVLNANRTYFLSRSQPPFLTSMILAVYDADKKAGHDNRAWLAKAYGYAAGDYEMWNRDPHLAGSTELSRYFDFGQGPVAEGLQDEAGVYRTAATYFLNHPEIAKGELTETKEGQTTPDAAGFLFSLQLCEQTAEGNKCDPFKTLSLTRDFYKGDRSMRESGFDVSFRFGPYGARTHHYAAVCLNSLLYKTEKDLEKISVILGRNEASEHWRKRADARREEINKYLWDPTRGQFFDYGFETQKRTDYEYISTFYPLWAGLATPDQAHALKNNLPVFERPGGLLMSTAETGGQWDFPYGWAPTTLLAIEGLRQYGFTDDANRLSYEFLSMVLENFQRDGTIREKYNVVTRSSETHVSAGYHMNIVGFGWTNAAFVELLAKLPPEWRTRLASGSPASLK